MKSCPDCGRTFPDEYSYCLTDGTPLAGDGTLSEEATVVKKRPAVPTHSGRRILIFVLAALLCLSLGATAAVLYFFWPRQNANIDQSIATASPTPTPASTPKSQRATPEPTPSQRERADNQTPVNRTEVDPPEPPPPSDVPDPGPTRITFRPGRIQETVSGNVSDTRSFILSARDGQRLSANITSAGDCVNFSTGDATVGQTTVGGNNRLTILNSCDRPARFTLTVSIR